MRLQFQKRIGQMFFFFGVVTPLTGLVTGEALESGTYMSLISVWACPVLLLLWSLAYQMIVTLPHLNVLIPIAIPTLYLWLVDTIALQRGTWSISTGTKLGVTLWPGLEVEEAVFFLATNTLIVFGSLAFDNSIAIIDAFPTLFPDHKPGTMPSLQLLVKALLIPSSKYDSARLGGLRNALRVLSQKSRSFYLASGVFTGPLRIDLILLYAFCRIADDLVDNSTTFAAAEQWIDHLNRFLTVIYNPAHTPAQLNKALSPFIDEAQSVLRLLPVQHLPRQPLNDLLHGFRTDALFLSASKSARAPPPIQTESDLKSYASDVASTVAELCLHLVYAHDPAPPPPPSSPWCKSQTMPAGKSMGLALQYINIARDVAVDAAVDRCYIPADWFAAPTPSGPKPTPASFKSEITRHRKRILGLSQNLYDNNVDDIEYLPVYARGGIRVAVESYMEIGRELQRRIEKGRELDGGKKGRATVPRWRRVLVGWWTLAGGGVWWRGWKGGADRKNR